MIITNIIFFKGDIIHVARITSVSSTMVHRMFCNVKMTNAFVEITILGAAKVDKGLLLAPNNFSYALVSLTLLYYSFSFLFFFLSLFFRFIRCNDDVRANRIDDDRSRVSVINIRMHRTIFSTKKKHKSFVYRDTILVLSLSTFK